MLLTVTGSYGTGSSAVTDLIKECIDICCKDDYEIRLIHDPDGISDLEHHLIENPNRHNTSHAIKRFIKNMNMIDHVFFIKRYRKDFGENFLQMTMDYVNEITELKYHGIWHFDIYERGKIFYILDSSYRNIRRILHEKLHVPLGRATFLPKNEYAYLGVINQEIFLKSTRKFVRGIVDAINIENKKDVFLDQLVPPSNIERYERYFDDIKIIIVERDPRDLFILGHEIWGDRVMPTGNIDKFCKWYLWTRSIYDSKELPNSTILIRFEDMIYNYDDTIKKILEHYGINEERHIYKKKYFKPQKSIGNTRLWEKFKGYEKEIRIIEQMLSKYCYNFPEMKYDTGKKSYYVW